MSGRRSSAGVECLVGQEARFAEEGLFLSGRAERRVVQVPQDGHLQDRGVPNPASDASGSDLSADKFQRGLFAMAKADRRAPHPGFGLAQ